jgi:hypothetical protein
MGRPAFIQFLCGNFTMRAAIVFLVVIMGIICVSLGMAWQLYDICGTEAPYDLFNHQISALGDPAANPCGAYLFTVALWTLGVAAIPMLLFYRRALAALKARVAGVFAFFFAFSIPGMFVVGIVPWSIDPDIHLISAAVAFGGAGVAYFLTGIGIIIAKIRDLCDHKGKIPVALVIPFLVYVPFVIFGIAVIVNNYIKEGQIYNTGEGWRSFLFWEWLLFFAVLSMCVSTTLALVRIPEPQKTPTSTWQAAIIFLVVVMGLICLFLCMSWQLYERCGTGQPYSFFHHEISFLGDPATNPCGAKLLTAALWTLGIAAIPLLLFYRRTLAALKARVAGVFAFFFGLSIPFIFIVGVVPSSLDPEVHLFSAIGAFGGAGLAYLLTGIGIIIAKIRNLCDHKGKIPVALVIPFLVYVPFIIFGIAVQVNTYLEEGHIIYSGETWRAFTLWEWVLFFAVLSICVSTTLPLVRARGPQVTPASTR